MWRGCREDARVRVGLCGAVDSWLMRGADADRRSARRGVCAARHGWLAPVRGLQLGSIVGSGLG